METSSFCENSKVFVDVELLGNLQVKRCKALRS